MNPRVLAVASVAGLVFTAAGVYARPTPEARPDARYPSAACGSERWAVKTMSDAAAAKIDLAKLKSDHRRGSAAPEGAEEPQGDEPRAAPARSGRSTAFRAC